jgi:NAD(P)-dependent dehydrogenase (short-subunit alcohol dehydrogenase family)
VILFTRLLAQQLEGTGVTVNVVNPGMTATNLGRDAGMISGAVFKVFGKDPTKGAETSIYLASSPEVEHITGEYFVKKKVHKSSKESYDMDVAKRLWDVSKTYVTL